MEGRTMTANEMIVAVGQEVQLKSGSLWVACTVRDVKTSWGRTRLLIEPVTGSGKQWVELTSVSVPKSLEAINA